MKGPPLGGPFFVFAQIVFASMVPKIIVLCKTPIYEL